MSRAAPLCAEGAARPRCYPRAQLGIGDVADPVAVKPNAVDAPAASAPLYDSFATLALDPLVVSTPFHTWVIAWPEPSAQATDHPAVPAPPAVTVTSPWKPPDQEFVVR